MAANKQTTSSGQDELLFQIVMALAEHIRCPAGQPSIMHDWPLGEVMAIVAHHTQEAVRGECLKARIDELKWHRQLASERYHSSNGEKADAATTIRVAAKAIATIDERIDELESELAALSLKVQKTGGSEK